MTSDEYVEAVEVMRAAWDDVRDGLSVPGKPGRYTGEAIPITSLVDWLFDQLEMMGPK